MCSRTCRARSPRRSAAHPPVPDQSDRQRHQVHASGRDRGRSLSCDPAQPTCRTSASRCATPASALRQRGHRDAVPAVRAGRRLHHAQLWRHGLGPLHRAAAGGADGRRGRRRERAGQRVRRSGSAAAARCRRPLPAARRYAPAAGQRMLIVDDNETNRRVLATHLAHAGYDVSLASSGREALVTMRLALGMSRAFDLVLADFQMPDMDGAMLGEAINSDPLLARSRVVLLTSVDRRGDVERFASLGFAGYLTKPIRARELRACLDRVLARDAHEWHAQSYPIVTANSVADGTAQRPFSGKVLLVEDNVVNQKVGQKFLERLGCEVKIAQNGLESLQIWQEQKFDLVLMDIQMPVMDGYTATRQIRDLEGAHSRTPVVALTANAMSGQLERCLQSGMDGLLTKPLNPERLHEVLERFGLGAGRDLLQGTAIDRLLAGTVASDVLDVRALRELIGGDQEFARTLLTDYATTSRRILTTMRDLACAGDHPALVAQAHQLKGASANLSALGLAAACERFEREAPQMKAEQLLLRIEELSRFVERVNVTFEQSVRSDVRIASH